MLAAKARKELRSPCLPLLSAGDALIFDYRILHRGKENMSTTTNRPILVITLAKKVRCRDFMFNLNVLRKLNVLDRILVHLSLLSNVQTFGDLLNFPHKSILDIR